MFSAMQDYFTYQERQFDRRRNIGRHDMNFFDDETGRSRETFYVWSGLV